MIYQRLWTIFESPSVKLPGQATEIEIAARHILKTRERLNKILAERTGQPIEVIEKDTDRDNFMTAQEAKDYGLIDEIMVSSKNLK